MPELDESTIRRIVREDREEAERRAADKQERADLLDRIAKLEAKPADHKAEPKDDDAHEFE